MHIQLLTYHASSSPKIVHIMIYNHSINHVFINHIEFSSVFFSARFEQKKSYKSTLSSLIEKDGRPNENWGAEKKILHRIAAGTGKTTFVPVEGVCVAESYENVLRNEENKGFNVDLDRKSRSYKQSLNLTNEQLEEKRMEIFGRYHFFPQEELLSGKYFSSNPHKSTKERKWKLPLMPNAHTEVV
jgi:hypothetical protein